MNDQTDSQLLRAYVEQRAEPAFAELVRRHVDFVYSAAKRMVCDSHLAEDVTQGVFVALAKQAVQLADRPVLSGWLHCTARNIAAQTVRTDVRRRSREQEAVAMNELIAGKSEAKWEQIAPHLDAALGELGEADRDALLLRYFERKSAQEIAQTLGISDEAAQKRVSRAVERLREFFSKRNITIGTSGLAILISANAVQSAPIGLIAAISAAAVLTGTAVHTSSVAAAAKTVAGITVKKTLVTAAVAAAVGAGVFEARQALQLREQKEKLMQQQAVLADQMQQLQNERNGLTNQLASLVMENAHLKSNPHELELMKLRGEIGVLHNRLVDAETTTSKSEQPPLSSALEYLKRADRHASEHEYESELDDLNKAIELDPNLADAYTERAALYASNLPRSYGGYTNAIADYTRYFELKPREAPFWHNRGYYYEQLGEYDKAISDYSMVIEGDLDFSRQGDGKNKLIALDYFYRGRIYQWDKHDYTKAVADYTAALQLNPQIEGVHRYRAESYELLGETEKAQQDFSIEGKNN